MLDRVTIESGRLKATIKVLGAELNSLFDKEAGHEYIWQGDPEIWKRQCPWLFPFIGKLNGDTYRVGDKAYQMQTHGFASYKDFVIESIKPDAVTFCLPATSETLPVFPWRFRMWIKYQITDENLTVTCAVTNEDSKDMYFSLGGHPGFIAEPGDKLVFDAGEKLSVRRLKMPEHLLNVGVYGEFTSEIPLSGSLFKDDAMLFEAPASERCTLRRLSGKDITLDFGKVTWLGIWSRAREDLRYVCVEPWFGVDDEVGFMGDVSEKTGIECLKPGEKKELKMTFIPHI
ncbi:MAG: aldose 1-epimerase family protein [Clostridia bacterium]|nr:aldose 1-epimerase family protein [Clostridia bacterium]